MPQVQHQFRVNKLARPQQMVFVREHSLQNHGSAGRIGVVVDGQQGAGIQLVRAVLRPGLDRQPARVAVAEPQPGAQPRAADEQAKDEESGGPDEG